MKLKKFALCAIMVVALVGIMMLLTGCDPEYMKNAGPGGLRLQPYNPGNGQYTGW